MHTHTHTIHTRTHTHRAGTSTCIVVDNEKTLDDLLDLLSIETFNDIVQWLTVYWWVAIIIIIGLLVLFILLQVTYRKRRPLKRRLSRARNSFRRNSTGGGDGGQGQVRSDGGGREGRERGGQRRRDQNRRQISPGEWVGMGTYTNCKRVPVTLKLHQVMTVHVYYTVIILCVCQVSGLVWGHVIMCQSYAIA